jgi:hypothetical protein
MIRLIRISGVVITAAIAASNLTSPASAQAYSQTWGTGDVEATHYDAMAVLSGTAFHRIRRLLVIRASRPLRRVPGRSIVTEDIKGLRPLQI